jgi:hypothetical protein
MAGNINTKSLCINGPWIKFTGEGIVRSNQNIDMLSEASGYNTDGLIEAQGTTVEFFTSSNQWKVKGSPAPKTYSYEELFSLVTEEKTAITELSTVSGVYVMEGDTEIDSFPSGFSSTPFNQIIFVNGRLRISKAIDIDEASTLLFVVNGNVEIDEKVDDLDAAVFADGDFFTAYNVAEGHATNTLYLRGLYAANKFQFQRTLQGTDNNNTPSEEFVYEPKYMIKLKGYFGGSTVTWESIE